MSADVTYVGRVDELRPHYEHAHVVVVPLHHGSGTRLKVVEAMAYGRPVVSTSLGAEGLPVRPVEHFFAADDAEGFAEAVVQVQRRLARPEDELVPLLRRARGAVEDLFWPAIAARLGAAYASRL